MYPGSWRATHMSDFLSDLPFQRIKKSTVDKFKQEEEEKKNWETFFAL